MKKANAFTAQLSQIDIDRIVEMAWEDRTTFEAIQQQFGTGEQQVIEIMRHEMKPSSFRMWRKRVQGRATKHEALRRNGIDRFRSRMQKTIAMNKMAKR